MNPEKPDSSKRGNDFVLEQMNSEYRLLQDKIDKIGAFRFTIRGWSVTLVIASIIAAGSSKVVSPYFLGLLLLFLYALYATERKQNRHGVIFGDRAFFLERKIREELRNRTEGETLVVGFYPGIAHHLHNIRRRESNGGFHAWITDPDHFFYLIQAIAIVIAIVVLCLVPKPKPDTADGQTVIQVQTALPDTTRGLAPVTVCPPTPAIPKKEEKRAAKTN
ncbi:MAG: hypothetical protein ACJ72H_07335 [Candidatus Sulfotelmatobacter sp.]